MTRSRPSRPAATRRRSFLYLSRNHWEERDQLWLAKTSGDQPTAHGCAGHRPHARSTAMQLFATSMRRPAALAAGAPCRAVRVTSALPATRKPAGAWGHCSHCSHCSGRVALRSLQAGLVLLTDDAPACAGRCPQRRRMLPAAAAGSGSGSGDAPEQQPAEARIQAAADSVEGAVADAEDATAAAVNDAAAAASGAVSDAADAASALVSDAADAASALVSDATDAASALVEDAADAADAVVGAAQQAAAAAGDALSAAAANLPGQPAAIDWAAAPAPGAPDARFAGLKVLVAGATGGTGRCGGGKGGASCACMHAKRPGRAICWHAAMQCRLPPLHSCRRVVEALRAKGVATRALVRNSSRAAQLLPSPSDGTSNGPSFEVVMADVFQYASLPAAFAGGINALVIATAANDKTDPLGPFNVDYQVGAGGEVSNCGARVCLATRLSALTAAAAVPGPLAGHAQPAGGCEEGGRAARRSGQLHRRRRAAQPAQPLLGGAAATWLCPKCCGPCACMRACTAVARCSRTGGRRACRSAADQILFWKKRGEEAVQRSGLAATIVRPGGLLNTTPAGRSPGSIVMAGPGEFGFPPKRSGAILRSQVCALRAHACSSAQARGAASDVLAAARLCCHRWLMSSWRRWCARRRSTRWWRWSQRARRRCGRWTSCLLPCACEMARA